MLDYENQMRIVIDFGRVCSEQMRPSILLKPKLYPDGNQWCALYGKNLQGGVAGFGDTPAQAMIQFDIEYLNATISRKETEIL